LLITEFDGCAEPKVGRIAAPFRRRLVRSLSWIEAACLLVAARQVARPVRAKLLGLSPTDFLDRPSSRGRSPRLYSALM
jgi:hypothetical protein